MLLYIGNVGGNYSMLTSCYSTPLAVIPFTFQQTKSPISKILLALTGEQKFHSSTCNYTKFSLGLPLYVIIESEQYELFQQVKMPV